MEHSIRNMCKSALVACVVGSASGITAQPEVPPDFYSIVRSGDILRLGYRSSHDLGTPNGDITRLVVSVHASGLGTAKALSTVYNSADILDIENEVLVVAPWFPEDQGYWDYDTGTFCLSDVLVWGSNWRYGGDSLLDPEACDLLPPRPFQISSIEALDEFVRSIVLSGYFPYLKDVVFVGHSAGAQYVARYAAVSELEDDVLKPRGLDTRYIANAPSTWLYFDETRPNPDGSFSVPDAIGCEDYDEWPYGVSVIGSSYPFVQAIGAAEITENFLNREIIISCGADDNDPNDSGLNTSCRAMFQGDHRLERADYYFEHLYTLFGDRALTHHRLAILPGVPHGSASAYASPKLQRWLFDEALPVQRRYVKSGTSGFRDGRTWSTAYLNLPVAQHEAARSGGEISQIWVAAGQYSPDGNSGDRERHYPLMNGVKILGGFSGFEILASQSDPAKNPTVLTGDLDRNDVGGANTDENSRHVIAAWNSDETAVIDGFTVKSGHADGVSLSLNARGANILLVDSDAKLSRLLIEQGDGSYGTGTYISGGKPVFLDCVYQNNKATVNGGGVMVAGGTPIFARCDFENNEAGFHAGGIAVRDADAEIINCLFKGNTALQDGGGLDVRRSLQRTHVFGSLFVDNLALTRGGAISIAVDGEATLVNNTVSDNTCLGSGGINSDTDRPVRIANSIFWGNNGGEIAGMLNSVVINSCVQGGWSSPFVWTENPNFEDAASGNYRLTGLSPYIDRGNNSNVIADLADLDGDGDTVERVPVDMDGNERIVDYILSGVTETIDLGAYELPSCLADVNRDGALTPADFTAWIAAFNAMEDGCDQNRDGACSPGDFTAWIANYNAGC